MNKGQIDIIKKIDEIVAVCVNHHDFTMTEATQPKEITGWDSLANAMILTALENEFAIKFKFADMVAWKTIGELSEIIIRKQCNM